MLPGLTTENRSTWPDAAMFGAPNAASRARRRRENPHRREIGHRATGSIGEVPAWSAIERSRCPLAVERDDAWSYRANASHEARHIVSTARQACVTARGYLGDIGEADAEVQHIAKL